MKPYSSLLVVLLLGIICAFSVPSNAQKKPPAKHRTGKPTPTPTPVVDMRNEAAQVAEQIKNITKFIYIYGQVQNSLEIAEEQAKKGQVDAKIAAQNQESKNKLVQNIGGLRAGVNNLLKNWDGNNKMQTQSLRLAKAADAIQISEQLAGAGRYKEAAESLVAAVERMTETMISMKMP